MGQTAVGETRTGTVTTYLRAVGLFSLDVRLFLLSSALIGLCWKGIYAVLYNLYLLRLGYGPGFIGLANAVPTLTYGIACLPAGLIGDRWGARRAMIAGATIVVIGLALPPCAEWLPMPLRGGWLLLSYAVAWVGAALNIVNANPYLMVATGTEERDHAFSVQMALWPMAGFAGSLLGGLLPGFFASTLGLGLESPAAYRYPLFVAAGLYIPAIPLLLATRGPLASAPGAAREEDGRAPWALIALVFIVVLLYVAGDGVVRTFYNVYLDRELGLSTPAIGSLYGVALLVATLAALAAPIVMARWGRWGSFVAVTLGMAASLLPLALVPNWQGAGAGIVGMTALGLIARPIITVYQMELVAPRWRATMSAVGTMGHALSWTAASLTGGYLVAALGYRGLFLDGAALTTVGSAVFWAFGRGKVPWMATASPTTTAASARDPRR